MKAQPRKDLTIRPFQMQDRDEVIALYLSMFDSYSQQISIEAIKARYFKYSRNEVKKFTESGVEETVAAHNNGALFVLRMHHEETGLMELAGILAVRVSDQDRDEGCAEIKRVAISSRFQRRGLGKLLMQHGIMYARDTCGASHIYLTTDSCMSPALAFYRQLGLWEVNAGAISKDIPVSVAWTVRFETSVSEWEKKHPSPRTSC